MSLKCGKLPARHDPNDLLLAHYATATIKVPATDKRNLKAFSDWGMLGNADAGDCVWAGGDHETMLWTKEGAKPATFTDSTALSDYTAVTGYDPDDPDTDRGTDVRTAYSYRRRTGLVDAHGHRHKLGAYVALEVANVAHVKEALFLCDAVGLGFAFPDYAMGLFQQGKAWTVMAGAPEPTEGHYVCAIGYGPKSVYVVTWGRVQEMSWGFFEKYTDECYGLLSAEFLKAGKSPAGFDLSQLKTDLSALGH